MKKDLHQHNSWNGISWVSKSDLFYAIGRISIQKSLYQAYKNNSRKVRRIKRLRFVWIEPPFYASIQRRNFVDSSLVNQLDPCLQCVVMLYSLIVTQAKLCCIEKVKISPFQERFFTSIQYFSIRLTLIDTLIPDMFSHLISILKLYFIN